MLEGELALTQLTAQSRKQAACVLEVLAGLRTPEQAALALGLTLQTYYNVETRALRGLIHGCTPTPPGRTMVLLKQVRGLETRCAELAKQVGRYQALLRNAQRSVGLMAVAQQPPGKTPKGKRKRRPVVRALRSIELLGRGDAAGPAGGAEPVENAAGSAPKDQPEVRPSPQRGSGTPDGCGRQAICF
jgi:hypothetical protein